MINIINWIKNLFKKEEFDVEKFSKEADETLERKLKIIYKTDWYKKAKKDVYEEYEEFKKEHRDKIGKVFESDFGIFKIIKVKEPWFLKSPILIDSANFKWKFEESFEVVPFDNLEFSEVTLQDLEYCVELSKGSIKKRLEGFA